MIKRLETTAKFIDSLGPFHPKIGVVLGSGLGNFIDSFSEKISVPYSQIPHFCNVSVEGHEGQLVLGKVNGVEVVVLQGRIHAYEGYSQEQVVYPLRSLGILGVENLILTNVSGGINKSFFPGDFVLIKDHLNLTGNNPLIGPNPFDFSPRFPDMTKTWDPYLNDILSQSAKEINVGLKSGIYAGVLGPNYETPAEIKMLATIGADAVGMSTIPTATLCKAQRIDVLGISCISNLAAGLSPSPLSHKEVMEAGEALANKATRLLEAFLKEL